MSRIGFPRQCAALDFIDEGTAQTLSKWMHRPVPAFASFFPKGTRTARVCCDGFVMCVHMPLQVRVPLRWSCCP